MGNAPCSQVHHLSARRSGNGRVDLHWYKPSAKGAGDGRAAFYRVEIAVDTHSETAYDQAWAAWVPTPGQHVYPRQRAEAAELSAVAVAAAPNWVILTEVGDPVVYFVQHKRGHGEYSYEMRGLKNGVRYTFTVVTETRGLGDAATPPTIVRASPVLVDRELCLLPLLPRLVFELVHS